MHSRLPHAGMGGYLLGMEGVPGLFHALASSVAAFGLSLTALGLGRGRKLVLRRQSVGGGRPAQGRRHDWVRAKGATRDHHSPGSVSLGSSDSGNALSDGLAGPRSIYQLLGNLFPSSLPRSHGNRSASLLSLAVAARRGGPNRGRSRVAPTFESRVNPFFFSSSHPKST